MLSLSRISHDMMYRKAQSIKNAIRGLVSAAKEDCGPRGVHWQWWRDKQIKLRKQKRFI